MSTMADWLPPPGSFLGCIFAKNVSSDSVNVSTLKGEGELTNLELNEIVLTDLLELPTWLRITRAQVNRVNLKIQWTKLKSVPILVSLDEVQVEMETCQELRSQASHTVMPLYSSGGGYGFVDKVSDGMTVTVNAVLVTFPSHAFHASFQLSRIVLDSKSPLWQKADLRSTRLKDPERGKLLIFKEVLYALLADSAERSTLNQRPSTHTNQARCRITIKKKLTDCSVVGCRLVLLMDDLLWVLTDSQLTAAFHFMDSLSDLHFCDDPGHSFPTSKSSRSYLSHPTYASCSCVLGMHTPYTCLRWKRYTSSPHMTL
ncbi:hypothetical protein Pmani_027100 [Petrolisthes manimaculis]|uniref:Chorein N-terminal domain-containing protein n=1 Tax=Petrolisthes manimaculis TaxID=1843537 RepID=A0AAE1TZF9_9EUCA|nr:hypothetical protein Pmani_027100 [Petrolisthes manimaculis]